MPEKPKITLQFPVVPSLRSLLQSTAEAAANPKRDWNIDYLMLPLTDEGQAELANSLPRQAGQQPRISVSLRNFSLDTRRNDCAYRYEALACLDVHRTGNETPIGTIVVTALGDRSASGVLKLFA